MVVSRRPRLSFTYFVQVVKSVAYDFVGDKYVQVTCSEEIVHFVEITIYQTTKLINVVICRHISSIGRKGDYLQVKRH